MSYAEAKLENVCSQKPSVFDHDPHPTAEDGEDGEVHERRDRRDQLNDLMVPLPSDVCRNSVARRARRTPHDIVATCCATSGNHLAEN